jgi:hypothetical protein
LSDLTLHTLLGSSGVVRSKNPLENICEKLTHVHKVVVYLVVLAHLKRRRVGALGAVV